MTTAAQLSLSTRLAALEDHIQRTGCERDLLWSLLGHISPRNVRTAADQRRVEWLIGELEQLVERDRL